MAFRDRAWKLDSAFPGNELTRKEGIRESIYRLWFSVQKQLQRLDPTTSPSDHAERVEKRVAVRLKADGQTSAVDDEVLRSFRRSPMRIAARSSGIGFGSSKVIRQS